MLDFSVPDTDPAVQHTVDTRPKTVAAWLDRLPYASPADAAQQLVVALHALNRLPLGADDRSALLTLYRPAVARAAASLETLLAEFSVPPSAQQRQIGTLLRELRIEHGIGYKQLLRALTNPRFGRPNPRRLAEFTTRLTTALRDVLYACHLSYATPPAGLWQDLHRLNAYARETNLIDQPVDDVPPASLAYRQALLIALADPPHMSPAELIHTRHYLDRFAALAMLTYGPVAGHLGFPVATDDDMPPTHSTASPDPGSLWLDTDALCRHVHQSGLRLHKGETPAQAGLPPEMDGTLSPTLFKRLLKEWGTTPQRTFKRYAASDSTVQVVAGLGAIHRLLEQTTRAQQDAPEEADSLAIHDVQAVSAAPVAVNVTRWTVTNDSAGGIALSGMPDAPLNLKAGDPLALYAEPGAGWSLGVIRWVRMRDARQVELGVERLSPQVEPVWVHPLRGQYRAKPEPALYLPGLAALKQKDRLLLPRHLYQIGMDAEVGRGPHQYTLTFDQSLEHTPVFSLIDFTLIADE